MPLGIAQFLDIQDQNSIIRTDLITQYAETVYMR